MDIVIRLIVHGTPNGQKNFGADGRWEEGYIKTFYSTHPSNSPLEYMKVERSAGKDVVYYTFIKSGDIQDVNGRGGGYVGITLAMNVYYTDIQNIYSLLQKSYEKFFIKNILEKKGNYWKFRSGNLSDFSRMLGELKGQITNYIQKFSQNDDFVQIPRTSTGGGGSLCEINLSECNPSTAMDAFKHYGGFFVSPQYPSAAEETRKQNLVQQYEGELTRVRSAKNQLSKQVGDLKNKEASMTKEIGDLNHEVSDLKRYQDNSQKYKQIENIVLGKAGSNEGENSGSTNGSNNITEGETRGRDGRKQPGRNNGNGTGSNTKSTLKSVLRWFFNRIIPILVLAFLLINTRFSYKLYDTQNKENNRLCSILDSLLKKRENPDVASYKDSIRIDLDGYKDSKGWLVGKQYKASIKPKDKGNSRILSKIKGEWKAEGLALVVDKNKHECELKPLAGTGKGKVYFELDNGGGTVYRDVTIRW